MNHQNQVIFEDIYKAFLQEFGKGKKMVLSTSLQDHVTSRMMSVVQREGIFYFQTDSEMRKYKQLSGNPRVALCIENIQIEGLCREIGRPPEDSERLLLRMRSALIPPICKALTQSISSEVLGFLRISRILRIL